MKYTLENNTFEIDNGYLFENIKQGNYYEATQQTTNIVSDSIIFASNDTDNVNIGVISILLDSESKRHESDVNHLLDVIGTIGGSFELIHYIILTIYITLRKNLYFYAIIKNIRDFQMSQDEVKIKVFNVRSRTSGIAEETKIPQNTKKFDESEHKTVSNNQPQYESLGMK